MNSLYQFIIKPIGERYKNKINIEGQELIVNSTISSHKFVNREAEVVSVPLIYNTNIKKLLYTKQVNVKFFYIM